MGRNARGRRGLPRPVEHIELNEEHTTRRLVLAVVFLLLGVGLLVYAFVQFMSPQTDWITVEANSSGGTSIASEFAFVYRLGDGELSPTAERRAVTAAYTQLCRRAYEDFHNMEAFEGVNNIYAINRRPNEVLEVGEGLYRAFETVERSGSRLLYLGPVYDRYSSIFYCEEDFQLADFDPRLNPEVAREYAEIAVYAADPQSVRVELLGENQIRLYVSEDYLAYTQREGIEQFIDFSWTRNAFIADYLAEELTAQGYTSGALSSYDGFVRNLDGSGEDYSVQIYDRQGSAVYSAAVMQYRGPMSMVSLRDYPINDLDLYRFYEMSSGEIRTPYLDIADGVCRSAVHNLMCYARDKSCGEILLEMAPVYIAGTLESGALDRLSAEGIESVHCEGSVIYPTEAGITLSNFFEKDGVRYTAALPGQ